MLLRAWIVAGTVALAGLAVACSAARTSRPHAADVPKAVTSAQRVTLTFEGPIDGSDRIVISPAGARWENVHWGMPHGLVRLNGIAWEPRLQPVLANDGPTRFLPKGVPLHRARLLSRSGRDHAGIEPGPDGLVLRFVDSPNGAGDYALVVGFE